MTQLVFEIVAENMQEEHIADEVRKSAVEKHGRDQRLQMFPAHSVCRGHRPFGHERVKPSTQRQHVREYQNVRPDQGERDVRGPAGRSVIANRNHISSFLITFSQRAQYSLTGMSVAPNFG